MSQLIDSRFSPSTIMGNAQCPACGCCRSNLLNDRRVGCVLCGCTTSQIGADASAIRSAPEAVREVAFALISTRSCKQETFRLTDITPRSGGFVMTLDGTGLEGSYGSDCEIKLFVSGNAQRSKSQLGSTSMSLQLSSRLSNNVYRATLMLMGSGYTFIGVEDTDGTRALVFGGKLDKADDGFRISLFWRQ